nr:hypothetical protein [Tanacetum cinerariifolium]
ENLSDGNLGFSSTSNMNTMPYGSKYKTAQELWAAILKTFGGNEATKKIKKNMLKQQYGNFKAKGSETLEQTFNRLQIIVSQMEFMDIEIKQDDLNQKFLTSLAPEWLMHTIVWRNKSDHDTMSLDDLYNHLKCNLPGSGFTLLLAIASFYTGSGNFYCQWKLYNWQWECLVHFIPNNPPLNLML